MRYCALLNWSHVIYISDNKVSRGSNGMFKTCVMEGWGFDFLTDSEDGDFLENSLAIPVKMLPIDHL